MGQSHSQPQSSVVRPDRNPTTSSQTPPPLDAAPSTATAARRQRSATSDSTRKRLSTFLRGSQQKRSPSSQAVAAENGPTTEDPDTPAGRIAPLSLRSRSLRKLFGGGSKGRKSWAPQPVIADENVAVPNILPAAVDDEPASPEAALAPADAQPSLASGSTPRNSSILPSGSDSPTPATPSSDKSLTIREIAMLSGSTPPSESVTPTKVEPLEEIPLPEEDPVMRLSRSVSFTSLVHAQQTGEVVPLEIPTEEDVPADVNSNLPLAPEPFSAFSPPPFPTPLVNDLQTGNSVLPPLPAIPPAPPAIPSPLPVIPAGTTMIIQGVVQAADERTPPRRSNNTTSNGQRPAGNESSLSASGAEASPEGNTDAPPDTTSSQMPNSTGQDPDSPSGAAELLGALLIAAASATANMLLSDPPGSNQASQPPPPSYSPGGEDSGWLVAHPDPEPSSVGVGPRPRRQRFDSGDRLSRPRSMINALRDRMFGGGRATDEDAELYDRIVRNLSPEDSSRSRSERERPLSTSALDSLTDSRDPIESLRERIANELMRALAARDGTPSPSDSPAGPSTPRGDQGRTSPSVDAMPPPPEASVTRIPLPSTSASISTVVPAEGTFERFLHDTNTELRSTLMERMNQRENTTVAIPVSALPPTEEVPAIAEPSTEQPASSEASQEQESQAQQQTRLVHRAPEGVIEPRLNWWRLHRFPARQVAAPPSDIAENATSTMPPSPSVSASSPSNYATAPSAASTTAPASTTLIPVIVVGIRTAPTLLVQEIGALASASTPPPAEPELHSRRHSRRASGSGIEDRGRLGWSRAVDSISRALAHRRRERRTSLFGPATPTEAEPPLALPSIVAPETESTPAVDAASTGSNANSNRDRTRNYLIWVIGGYYPESHPILTTPNLLLNQIDQDDFWGLAELLGQVKPPVASKADIDRAGLEVVKAQQLKEYEKDGKVTSNTSEKCLICLSDYEPEEDLRIMSCKHVFHQECVDKWLEVGRNNCPACRTRGVDVNDSVPPPAPMAAA